MVDREKGEGGVKREVDRERGKEVEGKGEKRSQ